MISLRAVIVVFMLVLERTGFRSARGLGVKHFELF